MSYRIELSETAASKIRKFRPDILPDAMEEIERLGANPRLGTRIPEGPLAGRMAYTFRVFRAPLVLKLTVLYQFTEDEKRIFITDFGLLEGDPPRIVDVD